MNKKIITLISCAVSSIIALAVLPACSGEEEIDVQSQAIVGNWLCSDIPTDGMTSEQAATMDNYYMFLSVQAYDVLNLDAEDCEIKTQYDITYNGVTYIDVPLSYGYFEIEELNIFVNQIYANVVTTNYLAYYYDRDIYETYYRYEVIYNDVEYLNVEKIDNSYYISQLGIYVSDADCDSIKEFPYFVYDTKNYYEYYPVYDESGNIESYNIYNDITESTNKENITLRATAYVTSEYYKDSYTTYSDINIEKSDSKYSAADTLYLRMNAGNEESYVFEMDGTNKLTMTTSSSIYSFTFARTESTYTSFCADCDYSTLHIRNEAAVGSWLYNTSSNLKIYLEIGAADKDTLYIKSASVYNGTLCESSSTLEVITSNEEYEVTGLKLISENSDDITSTITVNSTDGTLNLSITTFSSINMTYDAFLTQYYSAN